MSCGRPTVTTSTATTRTTVGRVAVARGHGGGRQSTQRFPANSSEQTVSRNGLAAATSSLAEIAERHVIRLAVVSAAGRLSSCERRGRRSQLEPSKRTAVTSQPPLPFYPATARLCDAVHDDFDDSLDKGAVDGIAGEQPKAGRLLTRAWRLRLRAARVPPVARLGRVRPQVSAAQSAHARQADSGAPRRSALPAAAPGGSTTRDTS
jgi:hypothetical protein